MQQKINYKDTLNLPRTDFPMKANLQQKEPVIQRSWEKENLFAKIRGKTAIVKNSFSTTDPHTRMVPFIWGICLTRF